MNKKSKNGDVPATQHDLEVWGGHLSGRIDSLGDGQNDLREEVGKHGRILEAILSVLGSIQGQLKEIIGVPDTVEKHEERITKLEVKVRMMQK